MFAFYANADESIHFGSTRFEQVFGWGLAQGSDLNCFRVLLESLQLFRQGCARFGRILWVSYGLWVSSTTVQDI